MADERIVQKDEIHGRWPQAEACIVQKAQAAIRPWRGEKVARTYE